ncbi:MAG: sulfite exporter TauE/SafE family protein [Promethearchaeota archaeon]|jgi:uncharacterized membrane protein YfcA
MDAIYIIILLVFGVLFGIISSVAGIGGGAFHMSLIILLFATPGDTSWFIIARDTSSFIIVLFSGIAFISYFKQGKVNIKLSLIFAGFALLGSITATVILILFPIDGTVLKIIIASVVLVSGLNMIRKAFNSLKREKLNDNNQDILFSFDSFDYNTNLKKGIPLFFLAGFVAYLAGIGGGMLFVPILVILFGMPIHISTATSTSMIFFIGIYNASVRVAIGEINYLIGILIGIGAILGSLYGARLSKKIPKHILQFFVAVILIGLAIRMYFIT